MPLGMEVGLSPGDFVLDGDPDSLPKNGRSPQIFGPRLLWPNGYMDQDATWYGGRPRLRRHCVRWGPSSSSPRGAHPAPHFSANVRCGQTAKMTLGIEVGLGLQATLCSIGTQLPPEKKDTPTTQFLAHVYCAQAAAWMKTPLGTEVNLGPGHIVLDGGRSPRKGHSSLPSFRPMSIVATVARLSYC